MKTFPIFKVNKMSGTNTIDTIYVFNGFKFRDELNTIIKTEKTNEKFSDVFTLEEWRDIKQNNIDVKFINENIHMDDSIDVIKLKIFGAIEKVASMDEMYLFCLRNEKLNPITVYQNLTQNDKLPLTKISMEQVTLNLYDTDGKPLDINLPDKPQYSFDDILKLDLNNRDYLLAKPLGQKIVFSNEYPFIANPFMVNRYDTLLERSRKEITTINSCLLLESYPIKNETIYMCFAEDVLKKTSQGDYTTKIYYPFLYQDRINDIEQLESKKDILIKKSSEKLLEAKRNFENINMFYNVFLKQKPSKKFSENMRLSGIKTLKVVIYPEFNIKIPIDVIFKLIHATQEFPLIKYNPETRQENIYRLFAPQLTMEGKKIPYLQKTTIFKLIKTIGKGKSIAVYTNIQYKGLNYNMSCEFEENGNITIYPISEFETPVQVDNNFEDIDNIVGLAINPLIEQIKPFFEQSGLDIPLFRSINAMNIEVREIKYQFTYNILKAIDINKYRGCISSIFVVETSNIKKGIEMRYKRVSNFNKRDSQEAFIIEKIDKGIKIDELISELLNQFEDLDEEMATDLIIKIRSELEVTRGANRRRSLMIKINPGFKTEMVIENSLITSTSELKINVSGINDIYYLDTIPVYINTLVRITNDINSSDIKGASLTKLCSGDEIKEVEFSHITAKSEQPLEQNEVPIFKNASPIYEEQGEYMNDLLDILGIEDDEELEGGGKNSDESIVLSELGSDFEFDEDIEEPIKEPKKEPIKEPKKEPKKEIFEEEIVVKPKKEKKANKEKKGTQNEVDQLDNAEERVIGMKLRYPNPFTDRLKERMPQLFVKSKDDKFDLYTRMCPFSLSARRQPIILTKEEKDKMVEENPGEFNEEADFITYGTDAKDSSKTFYYTCPRYWCLLTNTAVTKQDILDGKCGPKVKNVEDAIIPKKDNTVPKGKYVYQFYDENEKNYPGFHKENTPSGSCIPCCYSNWKTTEMKTRRDICQGKDGHEQDKNVELTKIEEDIKRHINEAEQYVKGPEKYGPHLGEHRWGFLPIAVQKFLQEVNEKCQISKTDTTIKPNHNCLLRHGVEVNSTQSFIACLANAMFYGQTENDNPLLSRYIPGVNHEVPTIKEMKQIIIDAIDIDKFVKYQNGDLITSFSNPDLEVKIEDYIKSKLYKNAKLSLKNNTSNVDISDNTVKQFIIKVAQSFENFKQFLLNDKITIDYTYLWDLVTMPNSKLFVSGINLVILEIPEDDSTNNIELVCPTNHYSEHMYDVKKPSLILIKRENYFEPIFSYNRGKKLNVETSFSENTMPKNLQAVFDKIIKPTLGEKCRSFFSKPKEYRFKQSPVVDVLLTELKTKKYKVLMQVLNFQGKVIGLLVKNKKGLEGFVPCYPSALTTKLNLDFVYMNDDIWKPYEETLDFLKEYYGYEKPTDIRNANCFNPKYFCRVVEDEVITGFLTNTNQFIQIAVPVPVSSVSNDIKTITNNDTLVADINTLTNNKVDTKRVDFMKRIQLETNFYNVFRNTIRILFNDYSNSKKRKDIQEECNKRYRTYKSQLDRVINLLKDLVGDNVVFADKYNYNEINENDLHTCISIKNDKCDVKGSVCKIKNNKCTLILPLQNLVNNSNNEEYYYGRMADELIRYNRIKSFIFKPKAYLSFGNIKYNLRDNEIIILEDLINSEFFENLVPANINEYATYNTYDTAVPIISQTYENELNYNDIINPKQFTITEKTKCIVSEPKKIKINKTDNWRKCFPPDFKEIEYSNSNDCSLILIIDIVKKLSNKTLTIKEIKDDLIDEYTRLTNNFDNGPRIETIKEILKESQQNSVDVNYLHEGINSFKRMIYDGNFNAKNFDIWILLVRYKIPSVFMSKSNIKETARYKDVNNKEKEFCCYSETDSETYVFIIIPAMYTKGGNIIMPKYKLIVNNNQNISIPLNELNCTSNIETAIDRRFSVEEYIDGRFEKEVIPQKPGLGDKKKQKFLENTIFLEDDIIEEEQPIEEQPIEEPNIHEILKQMPDNPKPKKKSMRKQLKPNVKQTKRNLPSVKFMEVPEAEL